MPNPTSRRPLSNVSNNIKRLQVPLDEGSGGSEGGHLRQENAVSNYERSSRDDGQPYREGPTEDTDESGEEDEEEDEIEQEDKQEDGDAYDQSVEPTTTSKVSVASPSAEHHDPHINFRATLPATYHVFGLLHLPDPSLCLDPASIARLQALQPLLDEFSTRKVEPRHDIPALEALFANFRREETSSHPISTKKLAGDLVKFAGSLLAELLFHLHYPSFSTQHATDGNIMDYTNKCTRLLIEAGFGANNSFWMNEFCRRERRVRDKKVVHSEIYGSRTISLHREWAETQRNASAAKVEVVFGAANRDYMRGNMVLENIQLWTQPPVTLTVQFSDVMKTSISRLIIFSRHPEHFFKNISYDAAVLMDKQLEVAAALAGVTSRNEDEQTFFARRSRVYEYNAARKASAAKRKRKGGKFVKVAKSKKSRSATTDPYRVRRPDQRVQVQCSKCGFERTDSNPSFWRADERFYVIVCTTGCPNCTPKKTYFKPKSAALPSISPELKCLRVERSFRINAWNTEARAWNKEMKSAGTSFRPILSK